MKLVRILEVGLCGAIVGLLVSVALPAGSASAQSPAACDAARQQGRTLRGCPSTRRPPVARPPVARPPDRNIRRQPTRPVAASTIASVTKPWRIIAADFNNDGKIDLAYGNQPSPHVFVRLGNGAGTFGAERTVTIDHSGGQSWRLVAADINGDGNLDLVDSVRHSSQSAVKVLMGNGLGGFTLRSNINTPFANDIAIGDFNGDGRLDIVMELFDSSTAAVSLQTASGLFSAPVSYAMGLGNGTGVVTGDFNNDGILDLVAADYGDGGLDGVSRSGHVFVSLGNGDGTFPAGTDIVDTHSLPTSIELGDLNGDGNLDIVFTSGGVVRGVQVMLGNGDGTFRPITPYTTTQSSFPQAVTIADVNGDGRPDLLVATHGATISRLVNNGDGTFRAPVAIATGGTLSDSIAAGDFDGDGDIDLAVPNFFENTIGVLLTSVERPALGRERTVR